MNAFGLSPAAVPTVTASSYLGSVYSGLDIALGQAFGWQTIDAASGPWLVGCPPDAKPRASVRKTMPLWSSSPTIAFSLMCEYRCFPKLVFADTTQTLPDSIAVAIPAGDGYAAHGVDVPLSDHPTLQAATSFAIALAVLSILHARKAGINP